MRSLKPTLLAALALAALGACNLPVAADPPPEPTAAPTAVPEAAPPTEPATAAPAPTETPGEEPVVPDPAPQPLRVAYVLDGNLWGLELGTAPIQLTASGRAVEVHISDDGQRIVYLELLPPDNQVALRSVRFDGGDDRLLIDQAGFDALYPLEFFLHYAPSQLSMLPGTHELLFNTRGVLEGPGLAKNDDLVRVNADSGALSQLLPRGQGGDFSLSPDGTQLVIVRPDSIGFARADGTQRRPAVLTFARVITYSEYFYYPHPVWVGDGVLAAIPGEDPFFGPQQGTVWRVPADGSDPNQSAVVNGDLFGPQFNSPIISPDGSQVAFYRRPDDSGAVQLWLYDLGSGSESLYAEGALEWRGWAPDSSHFTYQDQTTRELVLGRPGASPDSLGGARLLHWIEPAQYLMLLEMTDGSWRLALGSTEAGPTDLASLRGDFSSSDVAP